MSIKVFCSHCGRPHVLADTLADKRVPCKECERPFAVPERDDDTAIEDQSDKAPRSGRKAKGGIPGWMWLASGAAVFLLFLGAGVFGLLHFLGVFRSVSETKTPTAPPAAQRPAPSRLNRAANPNPGDEFGVHTGMTEAELVAKLGPPDQTTDEPGKRSLRWFKGERVIGATVIGGKATGMGFSWRSPPPNRPRAPNPGDEFGIRIGMTEAELIAKLGPPDQTTDEPGKRSLRWIKGKRTIGVTLIGGKATGMAFSSR
jgi:hypothetical protein